MLTPILNFPLMIFYHVCKIELYNLIKFLWNQILHILNNICKVKKNCTKLTILRFDLLERYKYLVIYFENY